jgi:hypothetical protein
LSESFFKLTTLKTNSRMNSQLPSAAKGTDGKSDKNQSDGDRNAYEPVSDVASPCAERGIQPAECEDGKRRADNLMKKLPEDPPKPCEAARFSRAGCSSRNRGHTSSLAQMQSNVAGKTVRKDRWGL